MRVGQLLDFGGKDIIKKTDECVRVVEETIFDLKIGDAEDQLRPGRGGAGIPGPAADDHLPAVRVYHGELKPRQGPA